MGRMACLNLHVEMGISISKWGFKHHHINMEIIIVVWVDIWNGNCRFDMGICESSNRYGNPYIKTDRCFLWLPVSKWLSQCWYGDTNAQGFIRGQGRWYSESFKVWWTWVLIHHWQILQPIAQCFELFVFIHPPNFLCTVWFTLSTPPLDSECLGEPQIIWQSGQRFLSPLMTRSMNSCFNTIQHPMWS